MILLQDDSPQTYNFPAWIQIVLAIIGVVGFLIGAAELTITVHSRPRRSNESAERESKLSSIERWIPGHFSLALGHLQDLCSRLTARAFHDKPIRGRVTESDLVRWVIQLGLTCAANLVPESLGKANLFRVSQIKRDADGRSVEVRVYSSEFVGIFSADQLIDQIDGTFIRDLEFRPHGQNVKDLPAALQCIGRGVPVMQSLRGRSSAFDQPERDLGATHVLAIPLIQNFHALSRQDQPVSITVDLRYGFLYGRVIDRFGAHRLTVYRRALKLSAVLKNVEQLADPKFLPPSSEYETIMAEPPSNDLNEPPHRHA